MTLDQGAIHERRQSAGAPVLITDAMVAPVVETLTNSFFADPVMSWFLRSDEGKRAGLQTIIQMQLANYRANGMALAAADASCAALWGKPGMVADGGMGIIRQLSLLPRMIRICGFGRVSRIIEVMDAVEKNHPKEPEHYYLFMLGVDSGFQGQGLGSSLLAATLDMVDREGVPAYLENSNPKNTRLYERHGFKARTEIKFSGDGPVLLPMWRDATK